MPEGSYIVDHAARFNRCSHELQDHMNNKISSAVPVEQRQISWGQYRGLEALKRVHGL